jgi:hypothetical protein
MQDGRARQWQQVRLVIDAQTDAAAPATCAVPHAPAHRPGVPDPLQTQHPAAQRAQLPVKSDDAPADAAHRDGAKPPTLAGFKHAQRFMARARCSLGQKSSAPTGESSAPTGEARSPDATGASSAGGARSGAPPTLASSDGVLGAPEERRVDPRGELAALLVDETDAEARDPTNARSSVLPSFVDASSQAATPSVRPRDT